MDKQQQTFEAFQKASDQLNDEVNNYIKDNKLQDLPPFAKLQDKETIGTLYRADQVRNETLSGYRSKYLGLSAFLLKLKADTVNRVLIREIDDAVKYLEKKEEMLKNMSFEAKDRVKFYQNIIYLIANMGYGDY